MKQLKNKFLPLELQTGELQRTTTLPSGITENMLTKWYSPYEPKPDIAGVYLTAHRIGDDVWMGFASFGNFWSYTENNPDQARIYRNGKSIAKKWWRGLTHEAYKKLTEKK